MVIDRRNRLAVFELAIVDSGGLQQDAKTTHCFSIKTSGAFIPQAQ